MTTNEQLIARFNELLRNELSAVETYEMALRRTRRQPLSNTLRQLRDDHYARSLGLRGKLRELGGTPSASSGAWGAWAKVVQGGADLFGDTTAIAALEQGEDHGLELYRNALGAEESPEVRAYVQRVLLPLEQASHKLCRSLKDLLEAAS